MLLSNKSNRVLIAALFIGSIITSPVFGDFFDDRLLFDAQNPGLTLLDFERIAPPGDLIQPSPQPWAPEVFFTSALLGDDSQIAIVDRDFDNFGFPSDVLAVNEFDDALIATFDSGVNAVGFDVSIGFGGLQATVDVFDSNGDLLDSTFFDTADISEFTTFIGVSNVGGIGSIAVTPGPGGFVLIDNFAFGGKVVPEPASALVLLIGTVCLASRRRR